MSRAEKAKLEKDKAQIEYVLIRQEFIAPTFLPIVAEAFLRDDFDFALYLSYALSSVLGHVFNFSKATLAAALVNISCWAVITDHLSYVANVTLNFLTHFAHYS